MQAFSSDRAALLFAALVGSAMLASPTYSYAQTQPATQAQTSAGSESTADEGLAEIIVTARRRSEALQDVPQTVTAVTPTELQQLNLQNLQDLSSIVPGLAVTSNPNRQLDQDTFRGVSFQPASGTQNTLGFYVNDTFVANNFVTNSNFDIGQIELLSGPQGTLRGEPSPSGSLTITTHRPDLEQFGGYVNLTGTNLDNTNENGALNLPIIPNKLAVRLAGIAEDNDLDGVKSVNSLASPYYHNYAERASVRFKPIEAIEANVMYQHEYYHQAQFPQVEGPGAPGGVDANAPANYNGPPIAASQRLAVQTFPFSQYNKEDLVTGQLDYHVLGQTVSYNGSYWKLENNNGDQAPEANEVPGITAANPIPREPFQLNLPSTIGITQTDELRIASETPILGFLDYTVGGFFRRTSDQVNVVQAASFLPGSFGSPSAPADPFIYNSKYTLPFLTQAPAEEKEYSEFAHLTFHLPYDSEFTVGGRHISYTRTGSVEVTLLPDGVFAAAPVPNPICTAIGGLYQATYPGICDLPATLPLVVGPQKGGSALPYTPQSLSDHPWIYNLSLSHKFNPDLLAYVNGGSSWRPPGVSVGIINASNNATLNSLLHLKSETSTDVEVGVKWTFLDNRARLNLALYHQKFDNFIYNGLPSLYLEDNGSGKNSVQPFSFNTNPDAVINGLDLDTGFRFTRQWSFDLAASYSNGHLTGSEIPCSPPSGGTTPAAFPAGTYVFLCPSHASTSISPNFNSSARSEYDMPIPNMNGADGFIRGLYTFYGRNPHADQFYVAPSYGLLNLYLGLRSPDGAWEAALFAKNALNTQRTLSSTVGTPAIDSTLNGGALGLVSTFGSSGYYNVSVTPRQEFGLTLTYSVGSR